MKIHVIVIGVLTLVTAIALGWLYASLASRGLYELAMIMIFASATLGVINQYIVLRAIYTFFSLKRSERRLLRIIAGKKPDKTDLP